MLLIATLLIIVGITKLYIVTSTNKLEIKEIIYDIPNSIDILPEIIVAIFIADGLLCLFGGLALLFI